MTRRDDFLRQFHQFLEENPSPEKLERVVDALRLEHPEMAAEVRRIAQERRQAQEWERLWQEMGPEALEAAVSSTPASKNELGEQAATVARVVGAVAGDAHPPKATDPFITFSPEEAAELKAALPAGETRALVDELTLDELRSQLSHEGAASAIVGAHLHQRDVMRQDTHAGLALQRDAFATDMQRTHAQRERVELQQLVAKPKVEMFFAWQKFRAEQDRSERERMERAAKAESDRVAREQQWAIAQQQHRTQITVAALGLLGVAAVAYFGSKS